MAIFLISRAIAWVSGVLLFPFWLGWTDTPWFIAAGFAFGVGFSFWINDYIWIKALRRGGVGGFCYMWFLHTLKIAPPLAVAFVVGRWLH